MDAYSEEKLDIDYDLLDEYGQTSTSWLKFMHYLIDIVIHFKKRSFHFDPMGIKSSIREGRHGRGHLVVVESN